MALPGTMRALRRSASLDEGLDALLDGRRRVAMEYSPGCDIPYLSRVDAGHARVGAAARRRGGVVGRPRAAVRGRAGRRPQIATHVAASDALYRIKDRAFEVLGGSPRVAGDDHRVRAAAADGRLVRRGGAGQLGPRRSSRSMANAGNPHYLPTASSHGQSAATSSCSSTSGASSRRPGPSSPTSRGSASPAARARRDGAGLRSHRAGARRRGRPRAGGAGRRAVGAGLRGRPGRASRADRGRLRGRDPASHRPQPRRERPRAMAPTSTITRRTTSGSCCPAPASRSSRALYFPTFGVRTEINVVILGTEARVTGPRQIGHHGPRTLSLCLIDEGLSETHMSTRKTTLFYAVLAGHRLRGDRDGACLAARPVADLVGAAADRGAAGQQRPITGSIDATTFRTIAARDLAGGRQHPHRVDAAHGGTHRVLRRRGLPAPLLPDQDQQAARGRRQGRRARPNRRQRQRRSRRAPAPASSSTPPRA